MAIVVEYLGAGWTNITSYIPFLGDSDQGIVPFSLETVRESNIAILRFGMDASSVAVNCGVEIRAVVDGTVRFGGYITTREQRRWGAANEKLSINYECQDYNSLLDRIVVPSYLIDAGDTDSTEVEALRATYLNALGVTAGTISTIDAAMPELNLSGTFRQCMEAICGAVGGALFYISPLKALYYGVGVWGMAGAQNLSDDLTVAFSHPYTNFVFRDDESRRVNAVYIFGEGIEGWYPNPPVGAYYQKIITDPSITTQDGLDSLGAAIVGDFGSALEEYFLTQWSTDVWEYDYVTLRHSDLVVGTPSLWVRRAVARARSSDTSELEFDMELGDHTVESNYLGPSPISGGGGMVDHVLLSSPYHSDADEYTVTRGALIVGDSTPEWNGLAHPAAANRYLIANAADPGWTANIPLDDDAYVGITGGGRLVFDSTPAPDQVEVTAADLYFATTAHGIIHVDGNADGQVLVANGTRYVPGDLSDITGGDAQFVVMAASATLANERVLTAGNGIALADGGAGGNATLAVDLVAAWSGLEFSGADLRIDLDATFNAWTAEHTFNANVNLAEYLVHAGDADTYIRYQADNITLRAGGVDLLDLVEAATDYVVFGAAADLNGNNIVLDLDGDSRFQLSVDDQVTLYLANVARFHFESNALLLHNSVGTDILQIRTHGDVTATGADIWADSQMGLAADENIHLFIDANDNESAAYLSVRHDGEDQTTTAADELFRIQENGQVGIMLTTPVGKLGVDQQSATGAVPVLYLRQQDVSEEFIRFRGSAANGVLTQSIVDYGDEVSSTAAVWIKVYVSDDGNQVTDQAYYILAYTLA